MSLNDPKTGQKFSCVSSSIDSAVCHKGRQISRAYLRLSIECWPSVSRRPLWRRTAYTPPMCVPPSGTAVPIGVSACEFKLPKLLLLFKFVAQTAAEPISASRKHTHTQKRCLVLLFVLTGLPQRPSSAGRPLCFFRLMRFVQETPCGV